ncbi:DUF1223 domain-containing protein [Dyella dinghuensis]|uniref:DUF1223 domain-containing protein n=2 Tax=Dyella dinghuensis TaxID=1920169 RepID=A0A3S0PIF0_9GAMM|nr:DUF1223 domain-containing protein [Dyella dinghuensis]
MANKMFYLRAVAATLALLLRQPAVHAEDNAAAARQHLVVVELFQSQGCSSCPPAEANLNAIAGEPGVLALSFSVTYWDQLGWKDTFATDAYTQRQWDYAHHRRRDTVWTPQIYINGQTDLVGTNRSELLEAIGRAQTNGPTIDWSAQSITIGASTPSDGVADVWLVRYDPHTLRVPIGGGENGGRTLAQRNVVRDLVHLGTWNGDSVTFPLPTSSSHGLKTAALVQMQRGGRILGASVEETPY